MRRIIMKDVFGTGHNQLILTAADKDSETVVKKDSKKANLVKIYLASVPSLEDAKDALVEISESIGDGPTKTKIDEFVNSILKITEDILDLTKVAVRGVRAEATEATAQTAETPRQSITPDMISGRSPIPKV